jgi:hypothetical protein
MPQRTKASEIKDAAAEQRKKVARAEDLASGAIDQLREAGTGLTTASVNAEKE